MRIVGFMVMVLTVLPVSAGTLSVKGLSIGMPKEEACLIIEKKTGEKRYVSQKGSRPDGHIIDVARGIGMYMRLLGDKLYFKDICITGNTSVGWDDNDKISYIFIEKPHVDDWFQVADMNTKEFAAALVKGYPVIKELKFDIHPRKQFYLYRGKDGYGVSVDSSKNLLVYKRPKAGNRAFD